MISAAIRRLLVALGAFACLLPSLASAQHGSAAPRLLRIGWLASNEGGGLDAEAMQFLRESLIADESVAALLRESNFAGIGLYETDGERDMLLRLGARELDVAFLPARLWAEQQAGYKVVLQSRRARDATTTRGSMVFHRGIVFAGPGSPLHGAGGEPDAAEIARALDGTPVATVSTQSIAGHVAPMLALADRTGGPVDPEFLWFESSADATRAVVCGLADVGICEEGEYERALAEAGIDKADPPVCRIICRSVPVPSDPVVFHPDLAPRDSELGRELKRALRAFSLEGRFGDLALQSAQDSDYVETRALIERWKALEGPAAP